MSEFSTIVSKKCIFFTGSDIIVNQHSDSYNNLIIICPRKILEDVENLLNRLDNYIGSKHMRMLENESDIIGPFSIIKENKVMAFGQQEVFKIPKFDTLMQHRLRCLLGLTTKFWYLKGLQLIPYKL